MRIPTNLQGVSLGSVSASIPRNFFNDFNCYTANNRHPTLAIPLIFSILNSYLPKVENCEIVSSEANKLEKCLYQEIYIGNLTLWVVYSY